MVAATTAVAGLSLSWTLSWGVDIATFVVAGVGTEGTGMH